MPRSSPWLAAAALVGFAANSVLCRKALGANAIDAATFTALRLVAGAIVLAALRSARPRTKRKAGHWRGAVALFVYAAAFSLAYVRVATGTGALFLFGTVQLTMVGYAIARGERPSALEATGLVVAVAGLAALASPGLTRPDPLGVALMATAGCAWGVYSILGRGARDPLAETAGNFARAVPLALLLLLAYAILGAPPLHASANGALLAVASGAVASGLGYSLWYAALPHLSATTAAVVQLLVPPLAALAGVAMLGETLSRRVLLCGVVILAGVGTTIAGKRRRTR